jgi:hypothetical protein
VIGAGMEPAGRAARGGHRAGPAVRRGPGDGVGGDGAFFLLLDEPEVYGLPPDPVVTTRDLPAMWRRAGIAAATLAAGTIAAFAVAARGRHAGGLVGASSLLGAARSSPAGRRWNGRPGPSPSAPPACPWRRWSTTWEGLHGSPTCSGYPRPARR